MLRSFEGVPGGACDSPRFLHSFLSRNSHQPSRLTVCRRLADRLAPGRFSLAASEAATTYAERVMPRLLARRSISSIWLLRAVILKRSALSPTSTLTRKATAFLIAGSRARSSRVRGSGIRRDRRRTRNQENPYTFQLWVRYETEISPILQELEHNGAIQIMRFQW